MVREERFFEYKCPAESDAGGLKLDGIRYIAYHLIYVFWSRSTIRTLLYVYQILDYTISSVPASDPDSG